MRIVVNDIAASKTGALSILKDFYNAVIMYENARGAGGNEWIFVLGDRLLDEKDNIKVLVRDDVKASRKERLKFDLKTGAEYFKSLKPDVLFSLQNTLPKGYEGRQVLYVHQPLPYQTWKKFSFFKPEEREYAVYQHLIGRMIDASVKRADKVIVQTQWMRDAIVKKTGVSADKVVKILPDINVPEGINNSAINNNVMDNNVIKRFFYPSGEILYKNHACILEAVAILKSRGITGFEISFTLNKGDVPSLSKYPDHEQVKYIGRIPREEVFKRYRNEILLVPSYIETFGYPPAESRAVGGRMIVSDCPFCHEVLEGYKRAAYFDPFDPAALADLMQKAMAGDLFGADHIDSENSEGSTESGWKYVIEEILGR